MITFGRVHTEVHHTTGSVIKDLWQGLPRYSLSKSVNIGR